MKRGFVHLIPVILVAIVLSLGGIGLVAIQRTQTLENQVLSSSDVNKGAQQREDHKGNSSTNFQSTTNSQSQSSNSKNTQSPSQQTTKKSATKEINSRVATEESSPSASPTVNPGRKVRTNFPITVNPATGEKIVTTPSGIHIVILPEVAIQNMIRAGFPVVLPPEPSPSPTSSPEATASATPEGTPSSTPEATTSATSQEGSVVLTELNNQLVYEIPAVKRQKFLGVLAVDVKLIGYVSAENGSIVTTKKSFFNKILDALSF